jgi:hypothetical protein
MPNQIKINKETQMSGIKNFVGRRQHKVVPFMDGDVTIYKLTLAQARQLQEVSTKMLDAESKGEKVEDSELEMLQVVLAAGVEGGEELTPEDFETFSIDDLSKLAEEIMAFAGLGKKGNEAA